MMDASKELQVLHVDFLKQDNAVSHHTWEFQTSTPVFRRGQVFHLRLVLNQPLQSYHQLKLEFSTGPNPSIAKHTVVVLDLRTPSDHYNWQATLQNESGKEVTVAVTSSPNAILGKYQLNVKTGNHILKSEENILYLLFNPWCKEDMVFMPDEDERKEYILNDTGCHYVGAARSIRYKPWNFGQFEKNVLDCCISLLTESSLKPTDRRDPVLVCRAMCAMMSFEKGQGVLIGNWTGDYEGGTAPYKWTGSAPILQQYYNTKQAVCFGQCWVFAGILTTVLRALGIPARSVTGFDSAHDTERNLTVDTYVNENGEKITNMTHDSVWNFHVWTDAWMKRPDLPKGYDGWQAVDATPQERSQGVFCCGPSPLTAIRKGDIFIVYDTRFVFSEVNGDRLIWLVKMVNGQEELHVISMETTSIGKNISTKAVGQDRRRDITYEYKYPEGSSEERQVMDHAFLLLSSEREHRRPVKENFLHMSVQSDDVLLGNPVNFTVILKRKTAALQNVNILGSFELQLYTGKKVAKLCDLNKTSQIQGQVSEVTLTLDSKTYINSLAILDDEPVIRGFIIAEIVESKEIMASEVFTSFQYPEISIELPNTGRIGQLLVCNCIFKNTLAIPLTDVKFSLESLGISSLQTSDHGTVQPGETIQSQIKCTPIKTGPKKFIVKLSSKQVKEINAQKIVLITK
ncbi:protein-glutamine gamma-glutamyltransferase 4 [Pan troglodytes]|uniref:Protein-glutamine gamma-glutamyltransferase 4 n=1 Tax=Pan troglodytes verus TaxID=37012 RepID=B4YUQ5_PANTV|nr:protein-glutamine gamma-glutamyltransferase 4 [Pan troglodytes]ACF75752.1 prostate-specific transglutaminase 4 [Pan troglodytes verus]ACF75754.1 prostate-specific transglutaminase 4 [Pan troglodytes verus]